MATVISVAVSLFSVLGGILISLLTNVPVSVFVTSLSFACYLLARFVVGPWLLGRERTVVVQRESAVAE